MHSTAAAANGFKLSAVEHFGKLLELVLLSFLSRLAAVFLLILVIHKLGQAGQIGACFQKTADIDLGTDEVTNVAFAVHERCYHQQVHKRTSVSSVVDEHFGLFLAGSACRSQSAWRVGVCLWSLKETAVATNGIVHAVLRRARELLGGEDNGVVGSRRVAETEDLCKTFAGFSQVRRQCASDTSRNASRDDLDPSVRDVCGQVFLDQDVKCFVRLLFEGAVARVLRGFSREFA